MNKSYLRPSDEYDNYEDIWDENDDYKNEENDTE